MIWKNFAFQLLIGLREKYVILWMILFPLILATFFHVAFQNLYQEDVLFQQIPVAVVESQENETFRTILAQLETGESPLLDVTYTTETAAETLLEEETICGIFTVSDVISLEIRENGVEESILQQFANQYIQSETLISTMAAEHPEQLPSLVQSLSKEVSHNKIIPIASNNVNPMTQYFYNLITMVCLYGAMMGCTIAIGNQANLSQIGARMECTPTPKSARILGTFLAVAVVETFCIAVSVTYIHFILQVDLGPRLPLVYLSAFLGGLMGISLGFMIGAIGKFSEGYKTTFILSFIMICCFFSGLMMFNIKAKLIQHCPILNKINPAAIISDCLYCLQVYDDYARYFSLLLRMLLFTVVFLSMGIFLIRRKKYASL